MGLPSQADGRSAPGRSGAPGGDAGSDVVSDTVMVAVYDDHVLARAGLPVLLAGTAIDVVAALPLDPPPAPGRAHPRPDVALVAAAPRGVEVARRLSGGHGIPVLLMTETPAGAADMLGVIATGAAGAVCRECPGERVARGLRAVAGGAMSFECAAPEAPPSGDRPDAPPVLSSRERRIAAELARGSQTEEIAANLHLSPHTVRTHVRNIQRKLGARTRAHAVAVAIGAHELAPPPLA